MIMMVAMSVLLIWVIMKHYKHRAILMRKKYRPLPSRERLKEILNYDPETGVFTRALNRRRWKEGQIMGTESCGYVSINVDYVIYRAHRLAWMYMTGEDPQTGIDHVNGNRSDNRWSNLRLANQSQNGRNRTHQCNSELK